VYNAPASIFHDVTIGSSTGSPNYSAQCLDTILSTGVGSPHAETIAQQLFSV
jgi:hypothetical protein